MSSPFNTTQYSSESKTDQDSNSTSLEWQIQAHRVMVQRSDLDDKGTKEPVL